MDINKRGPHISLLISSDQKSQFDMRRKKDKLIQFRKVSLTSIVGFPLKEKDTLAVRVEVKEISEIRESLELNSHMFRQYMSMFKRCKTVTSKRKN